MKRLTAILMILIGGVVLTTVASADDKADVIAAELAYIAALNAGDAEAYAKYVLPERSGFFPGGGLLGEGFDKNRLKASFDSGYELNIQVHHLDVKVYDNAAVLTGYVTGTVTFPDGSTEKGPRRLSVVWIKQRDRWKQAHIHISFITTQQ